LLVPYSDYFELTQLDQVFEILRALLEVDAAGIALA